MYDRGSQRRGRDGGSSLCPAILVTEITTSLARDAGADYQDRGEQELRGLPGSYRLFAVTGPAAGG